MHSGKPYEERGDSQSMITFLTATKRIASGCEDMDGSEAPVETVLDLVQSYEEETFEENSAGNTIIERGIESLAKQIEKMNVKLDQRQIFLDKKENVNNDFFKSIKDDGIKLLVVQNNRSISDWCTGTNQ